MPRGNHDHERGRVRDSKEQEALRAQAAFRAARGIVEAKREQFRLLGYSEDEIKEKVPSIGEIADILWKTQPGLLDRMIAEARMTSGALRERTESGRKEQGATESAKHALQKAAAGFRQAMSAITGSDTPAQKSPASSETKTSAGREQTKRAVNPESAKSLTQAEVPRNVSEAPRGTGRVPETRPAGRDGSPAILRDAVAARRKRDESKDTQNPVMSPGTKTGAPRDGPPPLAIRTGRTEQAIEAPETKMASVRLPVETRKDREPKDKKTDSGVTDSGYKRGLREVWMSVPEIRGVRIHSTEQFDDMMTEKFPGLREHRDYKRLASQVEPHLKCVEEFGGREYVLNREIADFARRIGVPEPTVRAWVTDGVVPRIYSLTSEALSVDEARAKVEWMRSRLTGVATKEALGRRLDSENANRLLKSAPGFKREYSLSMKYYTFMDEMSKGGTIADVARRVGVRQSVALRWTKGRIPPLIERARDLPADGEAPVHERKNPFPTERQLEDAIARHPYVKDMPRFPLMHHRAKACTRLGEMKALGQTEDRMQKDIAKELGVSKGTVQASLRDRKMPELAEILYANDVARTRYEARLGPEALAHRIDPSSVYHTFRHLKDTKRPTTEELADALANLYRTSAIDTRVQWADLKPYYVGGPRWLRNISEAISSSRTDVEDTLNSRLGLDASSDRRMKIGVVDDRLYLRLRDRTETNWLNIYWRDMFHFKTIDAKVAVMMQARRSLALQGETRMSQLVRQVTEPGGAPERHHGINTDFIRYSRYLRAETLHLLLDATGRRIQDIQGGIEKIGKGGAYCISNPRLPADAATVDRMFAPVFGAGMSDGHITRRIDAFLYTEKDQDRVGIFRNSVRVFGEMKVNESVKENGVTQVRFPAVLGRALESRGMAVGDKSLTNPHLSRFLMEGSMEVKEIYFKNMWVQDGAFCVDKRGHACFEWDRGVALMDPEKDPQYGRTPLTSEGHVSVVKGHGTRSVDELLGVIFELNLGSLRRLAKSGEPDVVAAARELLEIARSNTSHLMMDEIAMLRDLGINAKPHLVKVTYYEGTGRLSSLWHANTRSLNDAMRAGMATMPDDNRKRLKVEAWMSSRRDIAERVQRQLSTEALHRDEGHEDGTQGDNPGDPQSRL